MTTDNSTLAIVLPIVIIVVILAVIVIVTVVVILKKHGTGKYSPQQVEKEHGVKLQEKDNEPKKESVHGEITASGEREGQIS